MPCLRFGFNDINSRTKYLITNKSFDMIIKGSLTGGKNQMRRLVRY